MVKSNPASAGMPNVNRRLADIQTGYRKSAPPLMLTGRRHIRLMLLRDGMVRIVKQSDIKRIKAIYRLDDVPEGFRQKEKFNTTDR